ncbi:SEFIR domain-containing protein [Amycolatopsis sp. NPDC026612]|uniref:SEFIR domain-containing protein n=1 Tax=Amycolatopsis sp. NPDC026612 TaxID=3155466 RepID=UPI003409FD9E
MELENRLAGLLTATGGGGEVASVDVSLVAALAEALAVDLAELAATVRTLVEVHAGPTAAAGIHGVEWRVDLLPMTARAVVSDALIITFLRQFGIEKLSVAALSAAVNPLFFVDRVEVGTTLSALHCTASNTEPSTDEQTEVIELLEQAGLHRSRGGEITLRPAGSARTIQLVCRAPMSPDRVKVFVSYAHDDETHKVTVGILAELLVHNGIDVDLDLWAGPARRDWGSWAIGCIENADFVLIVASPRYRHVGDGLVATSDNRGVQSEAALIRDLLHRDRAVWTAKLLPVVLPGRSIDEIPLFLQPYCGGHYLIPAVTQAGIDELLRTITAQPGHVRPPLGEVPVLSPYSTVAGEVTAQPPLPATVRPGLPLVSVEDLDPFELDVHRAISLDVGSDVLPALPRYVKRPHDRKVLEKVRQAIAGTSGMAILVGDSSTGKTRACFEAVKQLPAGWSVWHPISPTPPQALLDGLAEVPPRTVVWLDELQQYLLTSDPSLGEEMAARLRALLRDRRKAPVLVLGTIWPERMRTITSVDPAADLGSCTQAGQLVKGIQIAVPSRFDQAELAALGEAAQSDPRLRQALHTQSREITQYLAGAPAMVERYQVAPAAAHAVIDVAADVRRLGYAGDIPRSFLERAAPGYLSDTEWLATGEDWLHEALEFGLAPCRGAAGLLVRRRPKPGHASAGEPGYRPADYIARWVGGRRSFDVPPVAFWDGACAHLDADALMVLAGAAAARGRTRHATLLYEQAGQLGSFTAYAHAGRLYRESGNARLAEISFRGGAEAGDAAAQIEVARCCDDRGDTDEAERWLALAAEQGDYVAFEMLAQHAESAGDNVRAEHFLREAVTAAGVYRGRPLRQLARLRADAGDAEEAQELRAAAAKGVQTFVRRPLHDIQQRSGGAAELERSLRQKIAEAEDSGSRPSSHDLELLSEICETNGEYDEAERLADQAARAGYPVVYGGLVAARGNRGEVRQAEALALRAANAGDAESLWMIAEACPENSRWQQIRHYGLEPDGTPSTAWW